MRFSFIIWETVFFMKFFSNLLAILNLACASQSYSGLHMRHKTRHYESYKHGSFHDYFAHALSVMRYFRQKRGKVSFFRTRTRILTLKAKCSVIFFRNQGNCKRMFKPSAWDRRIMFASVVRWWLFLDIMKTLIEYSNLTDPKPNVNKNDFQKRLTWK